MRLVSYRINTPVGAIDRVGALVEDEVLDLRNAHERLAAEVDAVTSAIGPIPDTLIELLRLEDAGMRAVREAHDFAIANGLPRLALDEVQLLSPLPRPNSIRDFMLVEEHVRGAFPDVPPQWYELPVYWKGNADSVFGPEDTIPWPAYTEKLDYELELCAVIGRQGRNISEEDASDYIAGYTIFNDWSARDIQMREMSVGLGPGLGKDFATSMGPTLWTAKDRPVTELALEARVNGEIWSRGTLGAMRFSFDEVIAHLSREQTLHPGDVLGSGTIGGGCGLELDRWLQDGDVVELEAEAIGVLRNRVVRKPAC